MGIRMRDENLLSFYYMYQWEFEDSNNKASECNEDVVQFYGMLKKCLTEIKY